jgi:hypothetical protein
MCPEVTGERAAPERRATRLRLALVLTSLFVHAAIVWLLPPADLRPRENPNELLAPVEIVEWQPAEQAPRPIAPAEPEIGKPVPDDAPTEPTPPPDDAPRARPRSPVEPRGAEMDTAPAPTEPPASPQPDGGHEGAPALPLNPRNGGVGAITSPRLSGSAARKFGGDKHGPALPPVASSHTDATPQTLAEAGFVRGKKGELEYKDPAGHFKATLLPDGRVKFRDFAVARDGTIRSGGKVAGMSEMIRSAQGKDLFWLDKKKLLERTEKLRLAMAVKWAEGQVESRLKGLYRDLLDIWSDAERTAAQRRERLFQRWDECVEAMSVDV